MLYGCPSCENYVESAIFLSSSLPELSLFNCVMTEAVWCCLSRHHRDKLFGTIRDGTTKQRIEWIKKSGKR